MAEVQYMNIAGGTIRYERLKPEAVKGADVSDINELLSQLTAAKSMDVTGIMMVAERSYLVIARDVVCDIVGMATLTVSHIPTGKVGHIDDVVVHSSLRGQGVGEQLMRYLIDLARTEALVDRVELTSHPKRTAANKLYQKLGLEQRNTNCYTLKF